MLKHLQRAIRIRRASNRSGAGGTPDPFPEAVQHDWGTAAFGHEIWAVEPMGDGGVLAACGGTNDVHRFDETGSELWACTVLDQSSGSEPTDIVYDADSGVIYVAVSDESDDDVDDLFILDPSDGSVIDQFNMGAWEGRSHVANQGMTKLDLGSDGYIYVNAGQTEPPTAYKVDPSDGSIVSTFEASGAVDSRSYSIDIAVDAANDIGFLASWSYTRAVVAFQLSTMTQLWVGPDGGTYGFVVEPDYDGGVWYVNGTDVLHYDVEGNEVANFTATSDTIDEPYGFVRGPAGDLYVANDDGNSNNRCVYRLRPDGTEVWRWQVNDVYTDPPPEPLSIAVDANGYVFVGMDDDQGQASIIRLSQPAS